jgi:hypothetical protein
MEEGNDLKRFLNKNIRARFRDGKNIKTAEGRLEAVVDGFVKIAGKRGTIVINLENSLNMEGMDHFTR